MSRPWILLCPSTRGISHALGRHLLRTTTLPMLATCRGDPDEARTALLAGLDDNSSSSSTSRASDRLHMARVDVTDESTVRRASERAAALFPPDSHHLHLAFALAGVLLQPEKSPAQVDLDRCLTTYRVNTLGPLLLMKWFHAFLPRKSTSIRIPSSPSSSSSSSSPLPPHAVWVTMSARVGSVSDNRLGGWYSYRSSKAAVNSLTRSLDAQLAARAGDKALAVAYHPGTVRTDLSRGYWETTPQDRLLEPEDAAARMAAVVGRIAVGQRGRCWDYRGEEVMP